MTLQGYPLGRFFTNFAGVPNYVHQHDLGLVTSGWAPDWADGFGFLYYLTAGPAIRPAANYNIEELNDPAVEQHVHQGTGHHQHRRQDPDLVRIDRQVMSDAVILPGVYAKALLYRNPHLTNVHVSRYYSMYDYANLGFK